MTEGIMLVCGTAASIGFLHTLLGPDHYIPFVAMSRVGGWPLGKTVVVTLLCGIAHVMSSMILGTVGIAFGVAVLKLENIEASRGDLAVLAATVLLGASVFAYARRAVVFSRTSVPRALAAGPRIPSRSSRT